MSTEFTFVIAPRDDDSLLECRLQKPGESFAMGFLSHLFYPWGFVAAAAYHVVEVLAEAVFSAALQHTSTPEMLRSHDAFLARQNRTEEASE